VPRHARLLAEERVVDHLGAEARRAHTQDPRHRDVQIAIAAEYPDDLVVRRVELVARERAEALERVAPSGLGVLRDSDRRRQRRDWLGEDLADVRTRVDRVPTTRRIVDNPTLDHVASPRVLSA